MVSPIGFPFDKAYLNSTSVDYISLAADIQHEVFAFHVVACYYHEIDSVSFNRSLFFQEQFLDSSQRKSFDLSKYLHADILSVIALENFPKFRIPVLLECHA